MNAFIRYCLEANLIVIFIWCLDALLFRAEKMFTYRRLFLTGGLVIALVFPFIKDLTSWIGSDTTLASFSLQPLVIKGTATSSGFNFQLVLAAIYGAGLIIFAARLLKPLYHLIRFSRRAKAQSWQGLKVIETSEHQQVFSFFRVIVIGQPERFTAWERSKILEHEQVHIRRLHAIDLMLINGMQLLLWYNPILILYKSTLIQLHEFEADARSVSDQEVNLYCGLLAKVALQSINFPIANYFTPSFTLTRITMIKSIKHSARQWKIALALPATLLFLFLLGTDQSLMAQQKSTDKVYAEVDDLPTYPGGWPELFEYVGKHLVYPKAAKENKQEGIVYIKFVIEKDGSLTSAEVKKGFNDACDAAALNVVKSLPGKWTPGKKSAAAVRTEFVLPITFKI